MRLMENSMKRPHHFDRTASSLAIVADTSPGRGNLMFSASREGDLGTAHVGNERREISGAVICGG
jgi:hypothetical protein